MKIPSIIAPLMRYRSSAFIILLLPLFFMFLNISGLFEWKCPFYSIFNLQCLGCGMTRAVIALVKGDFYSAFCYHPFSYLLVPGWLVFIMIAFLPKSKRNPVINKLETIEERTGFLFVLFLFFIFFGLARLIFQIYD